MSQSTLHHDVVVAAYFQKYRSPFISCKIPINSNVITIKSSGLFYWFCLRKKHWLKYQEELSCKFFLIVAWDLLDVRMQTGISLSFHLKSGISNNTSLSISLNSQPSFFSLVPLKQNVNSSLSENVTYKPQLTALLILYLSPQQQLPSIFFITVGTWESLWMQQIIGLV